VTSRSFAERVQAIDAALEDVPHAFGGALALAYWAEPRATVDIDLNVFLPGERAGEVLEPLGRLGADIREAERLIARDGQARVMWDNTPIDLFFAYDAFHAAAAAAAVDVPFGDTTIRILDADHLAVCKAVFNRAKDWVDIEAMLTLGTHLDTAEVLRWVGRIAGDDDPRYERIAALLTTPR
jgi:Nucleotidyl transferase AbiEii toxin, Type IV TA system